MGNTQKKSYDVQQHNGGQSTDIPTEVTKQEGTGKDETPAVSARNVDLEPPARSNISFDGKATEEFK